MGQIFSNCLPEYATQHIDNDDVEEEVDEFEEVPNKSSPPTTETDSKKGLQLHKPKTGTYISHYYIYKSLFLCVFCIPK